MASSLFLVVLIVVIGLIFDYTNGFHDAANAIATSIATKALKARTALIIAAVGNLAGAFISTSVASTISKGIIKVDHSNSGLIVIAAALIGAISWNLITWWFGLPSSSSHALIGGLVGAAIASGQIVQWSGVKAKVITPMIVSPIVGFAAAYAITLLIQWTFRNTKKEKVGKGFKYTQILSSAAMALGHGLQDAQKTMGVITLTLVIADKNHGGNIQPWVKVACAVAISIGTYTGGWRIMKTLGKRMIEMDPIRGVASQATASFLLFYMALYLKAPISTTHTITSSILGAGATRGRKWVRWSVVGNILGAWVLTLPAAAICAGACWFLFHAIGIS